MTKREPGHPYCCRVQLPIAHPGDEERIKIIDAAEFPGGVQQQLRQLKPMVESLLFGRDPCACWLS